MPKVRYIRGLHPHAPQAIYATATWRVRVGEVVDLTEPEARRLVVSFPLSFELVEEPVRSPNRAVVEVTTRNTLEARLRGAKLTERQIGLLERAGLLTEALPLAGDEALADAGLSKAAIKKLRKAQRES